MFALGQTLVDGRRVRVISICIITYGNTIFCKNASRYARASIRPTFNIHDISSIKLQPILLSWWNETLDILPEWRWVLMCRYSCVVSRGATSPTQTSIDSVFRLSDGITRWRYKQSDTSAMSSRLAVLGLTTLNEPKSKRGGYWLESAYTNYCFIWLQTQYIEFVTQYIDFLS